MTTTQPIFATLGLLIFATACAEPVGLPTTSKGGSGPAQGGATSTGTGNGGASTTTAANGGATASTSGGTTGSTGKGGTTGTTTSTSQGGTTGTTTATGSGGTTTTTTSTTPSSCGTTTEEVVVVNTPRANELGAMTMITPGAGLTIPVSELSVKFCFSVMSTTAVTITPGAMKIHSGGIENLTASPYYVNLSAAKVTVENNADGPSCLVIDVASTAAGAQLTGKADIKLDWVLDTTQLGSGAMLDPTKPAQIIVTRGAAVAGCGALAI